MKTAIVTGAMGNLGKAVVEKFINEGFYVIGADSRDNGAEVHFPKDRFEQITLNLGNEDDTEKMVNGIVQKHGQVDAAVLTVGGFAMGNIAATKTSAIHAQYQLNFETTYNMARHVFIQMSKQNSGDIFMVGSYPGMDAKKSTGMVAYGLTKSLVFRLAEIMNEEGRPKNVNTWVIVPSTIDTPQNRKSMPTADFTKWLKPGGIAEIIFSKISNGQEEKTDHVIKL